MIAGLLAAALATAAPDAALPPDAVVAHYAAATKAVQEPAVLSFDYRLEQSGGRSLDQTHRIIRTLTDERDETLIVDGKRLVPPTVRIYRGKRNRYTVAALAPSVEQYDFAYLGPHRDGRHLDYVFRLTPKAPRAFTITEITIDGIKFLPQALTFTTTAHGGGGSIRFASSGRWWLPVLAVARAKVGARVSAERLTFSAYRFPIALPPATFAAPRALPAVRPAG